MSMPTVTNMSSIQQEGNIQTLPNILPNINSEIMPMPGNAITEIKTPNLQSNMFKMQRNRSNVYLMFI